MGYRTFSYMGVVATRTQVTLLFNANFFLPYVPSHPTPPCRIERLQCHPGKSGGHVFWRGAPVQLLLLVIPVERLQTCNRTGDTKKHGRRSSRDDTITVVSVNWLKFT